MHTTYGCVHAHTHIHRHTHWGQQLDTQPPQEALMAGELIGLRSTQSFLMSSGPGLEG